MLLLAGMALLFFYAHRLGLPQTRLGREFWLYLVGGELLVITLHEFGHAFAAWAVHFRFKVINIGPLTVWKDATGHRHSRFDWKRLLCGGGYTGAVPTSDRNLRLNQILVVFAGPFVSLNACLLLLLLFLNLPGTAGEGYWMTVGIFAVLFGVDFIINLIPLGYTDGTLLLHLVLWTRKGREFSAAWLSTKHVEEADQRRAEVDFESEVELRRNVLDQALAHGHQNSVELAVKYQALGFAEVNAKRLPEAEQSLTKSLDILKQCGNPHPLAEANSWKGLHQVYRLQQRAADSSRAGSSAIRAFEKCKKLLPPDGLVEVGSALAKLHLDARAYEAALEELDQALANFPVGRQYLLLKATIFRQRAECEFHLGCPERGSAAAETAAQILRSPETSESNRAKAWGEMGTLGVSVWMAGRAEQAVALLSEAVRAVDPEAGKRSARLPVTLAMVLRKAGRLTEAEAALPANEGLTERLREAFLNERARIRLRSGRVENAIADFEEVLRLNKETPHASATGIATIEGSLAEALLDAGRVEQAEAIARTACDVLVPVEHPEGSGPLVTLALIAWQRQQEFGEHLSGGGRSPDSRSPAARDRFQSAFLRSRRRTDGALRLDPRRTQATRCSAPTVADARPKRRAGTRARPGNRVRRVGQALPPANHFLNV